MRAFLVSGDFPFLLIVNDITNFAFTDVGYHIRKCPMSLIKENTNVVNYK